MRLHKLFKPNWLSAFILSLAAVNTSWAEEYIIGVEKLNFLPYYSGVDDEYFGYARDILDAFANQYGHQFKYNPLPVERLFLAFINKQVDFKFPDSPNWQQSIKQQHSVVYSKTVAPFVDGIMMNPKRMIHSSLSFKKLGTIRGFTPWPFMAQIKRGDLRVSENNSISGLLMQTVLQRVEGSYINVAVAEYHLNNILKKPNTLVFNPDLAHDKGDYFLSTIKHPQIIEQFNSWLQQNSAYVLDMQKKWNIIGP